MDASSRDVRALVSTLKRKAALSLHTEYSSRIALSPMSALGANFPGLSVHELVLHGRDHIVTAPLKRRRFHGER